MFLRIDLTILSFYNQSSKCATVIRSWNITARVCVWSDAAGAAPKTNFTSVFLRFDLYHWTTLRHLNVFCGHCCYGTYTALKNFCHIIIFHQETQRRDVGVCNCWSSVCFKLQWVILNRRSVTHISLHIHWKHWHQAGSVEPSEGFVFLCSAHTRASAGLYHHTARFISHDSITIIFDMFPGRLHN